MTQPSSSSRKTSRIGSLNLTAMIDIVFLLLIYFVMTATFTQAEGVITANLPGHGGRDPREPRLEQPIRITLAARGQTAYRLEIDKSPVAPASFGDLTRMLQSLRLSPDGRPGLFAADNLVIIQPAGPVRWQHTVNAFNAVVRAGYTNITFAGP